MLAAKRQEIGALRAEFDAARAAWEEVLSRVETENRMLKELLAMRDVAYLRVARMDTAAAERPRSGRTALGLSGKAAAAGQTIQHHQRKARAGVAEAMGKGAETVSGFFSRLKLPGGR